MVIQYVLTSSSSSYRHFYPSLYVTFNKMFHYAVPTQDVTNIVNPHSLYKYIQGVSEGILDILGGGSMNYSEYIRSYKHVSNFQWVWRYSCLNVTHIKPYKRYEGKSHELMIAVIGYVNKLSKLQKFKVNVQKSHLRFQRTFRLSWQ
jgi:hypothetical protein